MKNYKLVIIGSGPAGLCAAIEASNYIDNILIIDENLNPGGQLIKQTHMFFGNNEYFAGIRGIEIAKNLVNEVKINKNIELLQETTVVGIYKDNEILYYNRDKLTRIKANAIIIATGASEKVLNFPGSDLPGVYGAGAVQTLMNEYLVKPGNEVLMIGAGNIGLIVSYQLMQAGIKVKAIVEASNKTGGYMVHANKLKRHGVKIFTSHTVKSVYGKDRVEYATICKLDENFNPIPNSEKTIKVDTVCVATGLTPLVDLLEQAGVEMEYVHYLGGRVAKHNKYLETTNPSIFIAGDVSGIEEATTAMIEGRIASLSACKYLKPELSSEIEKKHEKYFNDILLMRNNPFGDKALIGKNEIFIEKEKIEEKSFHLQKPTDWEYIKSKNKPIPVIECTQNIPCNPCVTSCKFDAITMENSDIAETPKLTYEKCVSCLNCAKVCPGLSIFFVNYNYSDKKANVIVPYEMLPIPNIGEIVSAVDKDSNYVCDAEILKVIKSKDINKVTLVSMLIDKEFVEKVRSFRVKSQELENIFENIELDEEEDYIVCRCEDITYKQIVRAIREQGLTCFNEVKRVLRTGMGPCQGKNCHDNIQKIIAKELNKRVNELETHTIRKPSKPISIGSIAQLYKDEIKGE